MNSSGKSFSEKCIGLLYNYYHFWHKRAPKGEFHIFYFFIFHPILMQYTLVQLSLVDMLRSYHASLCESMHLYFLPFCSCWEFSHINNLLFILIKNHMRKLQAMFMNWFHCVSLGLHEQCSSTGSIVYLLAYCSFFTVFRLLTDFVCLYNYEFWLSLCKIVRSSVILLLPLFPI
jgi:hypothetical protein